MLLQLGTVMLWELWLGKVWQKHTGTARYGTCRSAIDHIIRLLLEDCSAGHGCPKMIFPVFTSPCIKRQRYEAKCLCQTIMSRQEGFFPSVQVGTVALGDIPGSLSGWGAGMAVCWFICCGAAGLCWPGLGLRGWKVPFTYL